MFTAAVVLLIVSCCYYDNCTATAVFQHPHHRRWVTDVLHDALERYTPDGGPVCRRYGLAYREGLKDLQLWATRMYDASAKFPTGILSGKSYDFGNYDECLETNTTGLNFKPQYCIINIRFSPSSEMYPNYYDTLPPKLSQSIPAWEAVKPYPNQLKIQRNEINTALCIPSTCTYLDLQSTLSHKIVSTFHELEINSTVSVDSYYCTTQDNTPKTLGFIIFWLIPVYGLMVAFNAFVFLHMSDGPIWKSIAVRESENCLKNWWTNLLFVNNYVDTEHPCVLQSWYLACDLHMCAIGILMVYLMWKYPKCVEFTLLTAIFMSCLAPAYVVYQHNYHPTFIGFIKALNYPPSREIFRKLYITTHTRLTPYFVGMYAAHVYRGMRTSKPDHRFSRPTLRLWAMFCGYIAWMMSIVYFYEYDYNLWVSVVYAFVFRLVFAALVSAFIIVCAVNSCFQGTWTLILAPISRLVYSAYIGGLTMQLYHAASTRSSLYFNPMRLISTYIIWITIGDITNGFVVAFFLYMLVESPFENLLKLAIGKMKEEVHKDEKRTPNDVEMAPHNTERLK